jgi:hypothetical protein
MEELTLSELLDFIGSAAQGDILYRGASSWARLAAGTSGQFLKTTGAGSNPAWDDVSTASMVLLDTFTVSGSSSYTSSTIPSTYRQLYIEVDGASHNGSGSSSDDLLIELSDDNGSSYGTATSITGNNFSGTSYAIGGVVQVLGIQTTGANSIMLRCGVRSEFSNADFTNVIRTNSSGGGPVNKIRISWYYSSSGDAGTIRLYGVK